MTSISKHIFLLSLLFILFSPASPVLPPLRAKAGKQTRQAGETGHINRSFLQVKEQMEEVHRNDSLFGLLVSKVTNPTLSLFIPQEGVKLKSAVIICPGGGYHTLLMEREGSQVAERFAREGVAAFLLKYRLPGEETGVTDPLAPLKDAQRAIRMVRENADAWGIDPSKVGIMGFSAGGHLAATLGVHYNTGMERPDFLILVNPVISFDSETGHSGLRSILLGENESEELVQFFSNQLHVNSKTPRSILFHTDDDQVVSVMNSFLFTGNCTTRVSLPSCTSTPEVIMDLSSSRNLKSGFHVLSDGCRWRN